MLNFILQRCSCYCWAWSLWPPGAVRIFCRPLPWWGNVPSLNPWILPQLFNKYLHHHTNGHNTAFFLFCFLLVGHNTALLPLLSMSSLAETSAAAASLSIPGLVLSTRKLAALREADLQLRALGFRPCPRSRLCSSVRLLRLCFAVYHGGATFR